MPNDKRVYTIRDVAQMLGCSIKHAYKMAEQSVFPAHQIILEGAEKGLWVVPCQGFDDWLATITKSA